MCLGAPVGGWTPYTVQSTGVSEGAWGGQGAIQDQPGVGWQQTLKQRQNIRLLQLSVATLPGKRGFGPLKRLFPLRQHQLRDWRRARTVSGAQRTQTRWERNERDVKSKACSFRLTSRTRAAQQGKKQNTPLTSSRAAAKHLQREHQSIGTGSPASCPTLLPPLLLLITVRAPVRSVGPEGGGVGSLRR